MKKNIQSKQFTRAISTSSNLLFLSSDSKDISPIMKQIQEPTVLESAKTFTAQKPEIKEKIEPVKEELIKEPENFTHHNYSVEKYDYRNNKDR